MRIVSYERPLAQRLLIVDHVGEGPLYKLLLAYAACYLFRAGHVADVVFGRSLRL